MIEEVLNEIKVAEERADELQKQAFQDGKQLVLNAELEAEKQRKDTVAGCKSDLRNAQSAAEAKAAVLRKEILAEGEKTATEFTKSKEKDIQGKSDEILDLLLKKYGCK